MRKYTKKATRVRGGFTTPPFKSRPRRTTPLKPMNTNEYVASALKNKARKSSSPGKTFARYLTKLAVEKVTADIAGTVYQQIISPDSTKKGQSNGTTPSSTRSTLVRSASMFGSVGKRIRTSFDTGFPSTSTINKSATMNGEQRVTQSDTEVNYKENNAPRTSLRIAYGFNRKEIAWFGSDFAWTIEDLRVMTGISTIVGDNPEQVQRVYWLTKYFGQKYKILNTNKFTSTKVKIHICKQNLVSAALTTLPGYYYNAAHALTTDQEAGKIPVHLQLSNPVNVGIRYNVAVDPKFCNITSSERFNNAVTVVKTFTKWLQPGDTWEFDHKHHTGPGLRLDKIYGDSVMTGLVNTNSAAFYFPVFEVIGPMVECYESTAPDHAYVGTSSGDIRIEAMKYAKICQAQEYLNSVYDGTSGFERSQWAFRVYTDPEASAQGVGTDRFNVSYENILRTGEAAASGKYIIPITTDSDVIRAGKSKQP